MRIIIEIIIELISTIFDISRIINKITFIFHDRLFSWGNSYGTSHSRYSLFANALLASIVSRLKKHEEAVR